jgi:hypothetical protein
MGHGRRRRTGFLVVGGALVVVAVFVWATGWVAPGDPVSRVSGALVETYEMGPLPAEEGFSMGAGWSVATYVSSQSPAATPEEVRARIAAECPECTVEPYAGDAMIVSHARFVSKAGDEGGDPGFSRFLIVTWEGPLGDKPDGALSLIDVRRKQ